MFQTKYISLCCFDFWKKKSAEINKVQIPFSQISHYFIPSLASVTDHLLLYESLQLQFGWKNNCLNVLPVFLPSKIPNISRANLQWRNGIRSLQVCRQLSSAFHLSDSPHFNSVHLYTNCEVLTQTYTVVDLTSLVCSAGGLHKLMLASLNITVYK